MLTRTKAALATALMAATLIGSPAAFAYELFDVDIFRPVPGQGARDAFAHDMHWQTRPVVKPFTAEEKALFDRASRLGD